MKILFNIGLILAAFFIYASGSPLYRDGNVLRHSKCSDKASLNRASPYGGRGGEVNRAATVKTKPCHPSPCGTHSQCHEVYNIAVCSCLPGYIGTPPTCRPVCMVSKECPENKACRNHICIDPCVGACGVGAVCKVLDHIPYCSCPSAFRGDPFVGCYLKSPATKPCHLPLCGQNSQCREVDNKAVCSCLPGYRGTPPTCTANFVISNVYPRKDACTTPKCTDPCHGVCGAGARCEVVNYRPTCMCPQGFSGDPSLRCYLQTEAKTLKTDPPVTYPRRPDYANYKQYDEQSKRNCFPKLSSPSPISKLRCLSNRDCVPDLACINQTCKDPCLGSCGANAVCKVVSHHAICACDIGYHGNPLIGCRLIKNLEISRRTSQCIPSPCGSNTICKERNGAVSCTCMPFYIGNPLESCRPIEKRVMNGTDSQVGENVNKSERSNDSKRLYGVGKRLGDVSSRSEKYSGSDIEDNTKKASKGFRNETSRQFGKLNSKSESDKVIRATSNKDNNGGVARDLESMKSGSEIIESKTGEDSFEKFASKGVRIDQKNEAIENIISEEVGYVVRSLGGESFGELVGTIEEFESAKTKSEENKKGVGGLKNETLVQSEKASNKSKNASPEEKVNFNFPSGPGNKTLVKSEKANNEFENASHKNEVNFNFTSGSGNKTLVESEKASNEFKNARNKDKVNFNFTSESKNNTLVPSEEASNGFKNASHKDKVNLVFYSGSGNKTVFESEKVSNEFKNASYKGNVNFNYTSGSGNKTLVQSEKASNESKNASHKDKLNFNSTSESKNKTLVQSEEASDRFKNASHKDKVNIIFYSGSGNKTVVESEKASNKFKNASQKDKVNFNFTSGSGNKTLVESKKASNEFKNASHKDRVNFNSTSGLGNKALLASEKVSYEFKNASHNDKVNFNFTSVSGDRTVAKLQNASNESKIRADEVGINSTSGSRKKVIESKYSSRIDEVNTNSTSRSGNKTPIEAQKTGYDFKNSSNIHKVNIDASSESENKIFVESEKSSNEFENSRRADELNNNATRVSGNKTFVTPEKSIYKFKNLSLIDKMNPNATSRSGNKILIKPEKLSNEFSNSSSIDDLNINSSSGSGNKTNEFKHLSSVEQVNTNTSRFMIDNKINFEVYEVPNNNNGEDMDMSKMKKEVRVNGDSVNVIRKSSGEVEEGGVRSRGGFATGIGVEYIVPKYNNEIREAVKRNDLSGSGSDKNAKLQNATINSVDGEVGFRINRAAYMDKDASSESATHESTNSESASSESASSESASSKSESDTSREVEEREFGNKRKRKNGNATDSSLN